MLNLIGISMIRNLSTSIPYSRKKLLMSANLANHTNNMKRYISPLLVFNLITLTNPNNPRSSRQKYVITNRGCKVAQYLFEQDITNDG